MYRLDTMQEVKNMKKKMLRLTLVTVLGSVVIAIGSDCRLHCQKVGA